MKIVLKDLIESYLPFFLISFPFVILAGKLVLLLVKGIELQVRISFYHLIFAGINGICLIFYSILQGYGCEFVYFLMLSFLAFWNIYLFALAISELASPS